MPVALRKMVVLFWIPFLLLSNEFLVTIPLIPSYLFSNVLIDFLTIIKYKKKDINNI
jgi:hypothetical protein